MNLDIDDELRVIREGFVSARKGGGDALPMALVTSTDGTKTIVGLAGEGLQHLEAVAAIVAGFDAEVVVIWRDAWMNSQALDDPDEDYLRPTEDPLAREMLTVLVATKDTARSWFFPYIMEQGEVRWVDDDPIAGEQDPDNIQTRGLAELQAALR